MIAPLADAIFYVMPVPLIVGIYLLVRGIRGTAQLSEPGCAKCRYDLRMVSFDEGTPQHCPECGADLARRAAVRCARLRCRPWVIAAGAAVVVVMLLLFAVVAFQSMRASGTRLLSSYTNGELIARLTSDEGMQEPWTWQELDSRYRTGTLTNAEVVVAIDHLIAWLKQSPRDSGRRMLFWQDSITSLIFADGRAIGSIPCGADPRSRG